MRKLLPALALALALGHSAVNAADVKDAPAATASVPAATLTLRADQTGPVIRKEIYGHFSEHLGRCIYEGIWVGPNSTIPNTRGVRNDVVAALKALKVPFVRWPGGCFADEYHWRDGIGPSEKRPSMINTHWGGTVEDNSFGTHEYFDFIEQIGAEAYVSVNVGSGTVQETMEWVEYMTSDSKSPMADLRRANGREQPFKVKYIGVGNETWGCGGNMRPEYYADVYRRYNTYIKNYGKNKVERVACGASASDYNWTEVMMQRVGKEQMQGLSLHYYTLPTGSWKGSKGSATEFGEAEYHKTLHETLKIEEMLEKHSAVMDKYDPEKKVGMIVDEWGTWYDVEPGTNPGWLYQQNTVRDAVVAGINLNLFHKHADRVTMAAIAQVVNVLQSVILTEKEKMILTPTYHVMRMYNVHQDAVSLPIVISTPRYEMNGMSIPSVSASASRDAAGKIHVSLVNTEAKRSVKVAASLVGVKAKSVTGEILTGETLNSRNTFEKPEAVKPAAFKGATIKGETLEVDLPAHSVVVLEITE